MRWIEDLPLKRKLTLVIVGTCTVSLITACAALAVYEMVDFRRTMARDMTVLADILGANTHAALAFDDGEAANGLLRALQAEPHIVAARVFDREGVPFAAYVRPDPREVLPVRPGELGHRFTYARLELFRPIVIEGRRIGTIYLSVDLDGLHERLGVFAGIALLVLMGSTAVALALSTRLQRPVSRPILALAELAGVVAERNDYTVRAAPGGRDEVGQLADAFNRMLAKIHGQNEALRDGEARVRAIIDSALSAVVVIDSGGRVIDWNARAEEMFGRPRADVLGAELAELVIPERYRAAHRRGIERFLSGGEGTVVNRPVEVSALRRDGGEFPVELSISPVRTAGGMTFCGFITDITERKRMEELRVQMASIVESSEDAIISKSLDGIIITWNPGAERLFGFTADEAVGRPMLICIPPERAEEEDRLLAMIARGEKIQNFETVRQRKDGSRIDVSVTVSPVKDASGKVVGAAKIARSIAAQKESEARIRSQLARLDLLNRITRAIGERQDLESVFQVVIRRLEEDLPVDFACVCLYDPVSAELSVSNVGIRGGVLASAIALPRKTVIPIDENGLSRCVSGTLVYEPELGEARAAFPRQLVAGGLHSLVAVPLVVDSGIFGALLVARREPGAFSSGECEFLRQLGEQVALAAHQTQLHGALQAAYDDLRVTQQAVMQQERLRALGQMASGIAHDINNAISPVMIYTDSLLEREEGLSPRARKYLETINRAIGDVAHTVARMREFYRQRESQAVFEPVDLSEMVRQVIDLTRARWYDMPLQRGQSIQVETDLADDAPRIPAVPSEIREALINLVFNAVDSMPDGGRLTLRTRCVPGTGPGAGRVWLEVADTGIGMDEETRRRCLEPFFTTKGERGTGLGLAMVYGVVQRHQADLAIDSARGVGTTMRMGFRIADLARVADPPARAREEAAPRRILAVDDDPLILRSLSDALEAEGHAVTVANGGQAGIDAFVEALRRGSPFEAVLTDLGMPHVDGRKVASAIKEASPSTPVILLTGWGQRLVSEGDVPAHVDVVLSKPPKLVELRDALHRCFQSASSGGGSTP